jgi:Excalibur calcium-binding domain
LCQFLNMTRGKENRIWGIGGVALIAFLFGRASVDDTPKPPASAEQPQQFLASPSVQAEPQGFEVAARPMLEEPDESYSTYFANCSEARAAGAAPVHYNDPGYAVHLDRDRDGVGCE